MLVLVTYAISLIGRVDTQVGIAASYQVQARQRAIAGLRIAMANLQVAAGGDVITASASIRGLSVAYPFLMGIWNPTSTSALPQNWYVSGNFESSGPNRITYASIPSTTTAVTLVGSNTVTANRDMVRTFRVSEGNGGYAFWIGDEGNKASLGFDQTAVPLGGTGIPLQTDPRGEVSAFNPTNRASIHTWEQIPLCAPGASLKSRYHAYTGKAFWYTGAGTLQGGLFNVNTTESDAWAAVLRAYNAARSSSEPELADSFGNDLTGDLANTLVGNFSQKTGTAKVRSGPFRSVAGFWDSQIVQDSLDELGITTVTQDDIRNVIDPMLAVRSDTFRIRAYGDAINPADAGVAGATPEAVAYCEAIVQRTNQDDPLGNGKKFVITYFRWLGPDDI
ncbi:MAG: hypothetical protein H7A44_10785 [Opitutaceae bacterium]|nr:hypothetical protein [Opitutaceae bacterium]